MYVVTNRKLYEGRTRRSGLDIFGDEPNEKGPNELRLVEVTRQDDGAYEVEPLDGKPLPRGEVEALAKLHGFEVDPQVKWYASLRVASELMRRAIREKKHLLVYVHGYNNDMGDVLGTADALEQLYNVIVIPFSWPANGGGVATGTAAYLSDKRDARASMDALNRTLEKIQQYHLMLTEAHRRALWTQAEDEYPRNPQAARERYAQLLQDDCQVNLSLVCHSMGNYLLKYALQPSNAASRKLVFDNVTLAAADTNNAEHASWVEGIQVRNRLYITINEDDYALAASRRKPGDEQRERLGAYLKNLVAGNATYIDVTGAQDVGKSHSYFHGDVAQANPRVRKFFAAAFEGGRGEMDLAYQADVNVYRLS